MLIHRYFCAFQFSLALERSVILVEESVDFADEKYSREIREEVSRYLTNELMKRFLLIYYIYGRAPIIRTQSVIQLHQSSI